MGILMSIKDRLEAKSISKIELLQRKSFIQEVNKIPTQEGKALSVSCGNGLWDYLVLASGRFERVVATDIVKCPVAPDDVSMLQKLGKWEFCQVEPDRELPIREETFDLVFSQDVIEHTPKPFLFLKDQFRLLKKGGHLIVGTPNLLRPANIARMLMGGGAFPRVIGHDPVIGDYVHVQEFHERQLYLVLDEIGFKKINVRSLFFGFPPHLAFLEEPTRGMSRVFCHFLQGVAEK